MGFTTKCIITAICGIILFLAGTILTGFEWEKWDHLWFAGALGTLGVLQALGGFLALLLVYKGW